MAIVETCRHSSKLESLERGLVRVCGIETWFKGGLDGKDECHPTIFSSAETISLLVPEIGTSHRKPLFASSRFFTEPGGNARWHANSTREVIELLNLKLTSCRTTSLACDLTAMCPGTDLHWRSANKMWLVPFRRRMGGWTAVGFDPSTA